MNTTGRLFLRLILVCISSAILNGSPDAAAAVAARPSTNAASEWRVKSRSEHQTEWSTIRYSTNAGTGRVRATTNSYVELATGLNRLDPATGQWVESREFLELTKDGAVARQAGHQAVFAANLNTSGAIELTTIDRKVLRSHVLGLAYTDAASGKSILIAGIKSSVGEIVGNQVIYRDAFDGKFKADVRYTYSKAGFEQDVILRENPPSPADYGMDPSTARLEVWTEFLDAPQPVKTVSDLKVETDLQVRQAMVDPDLTDESLDFGAMRIGIGNAFPLEGNPDALDRTDVPVGKNWLRLEGRDFLIEKVDYGDVLPDLEKLPASVAALQPAPGIQQAALQAQPRQQLLAGLKPPAHRQARNGAASQPMRMAAMLTPEKGFVLDYSAVSSQSDMVFRGDTTYYVSSSVNLTLSTVPATVIEGGSVVKFAAGGSLNISGAIDCRTDPFRPAYFVAKDDSSVGEAIGTGTPSGYYATYIFKFTDATTSYDLHDLRLRHGNQGIYRSVGSSSTPITLRHSQVQDCNRAFGNYLSPINLRNVLVYRTKIGFYSVAVDVGENVTFHLIRDLVTGPSQPPLQLKNTLLISCTNYVSYVADPTVINQLSDTGIFQSSGLGYHYLAAGSPYRGVGTPNINASLLSDLKQTTTWPPYVLSGTLAANQVLAPVVTRNSTTAPDLGYAYGVMDFMAQNPLIEGSIGTPVTLLVTNGAVIGMDPIAGSYGIQFGAYSDLISFGTPDKLNHFVPLQIVQENGPASVNPSPYFTLLNGAGLGSYPNAFFRFSDLSIIAGTYRHMAYWNGGFIKLAFQDCQVRGGGVSGLYLASDIPNHSVALTNTLFEQVELTYHP